MLVALAGCATPTQRAAETARQLDLRGERVVGTSFEHVVYQRAVEPRDDRAGILHVYLEGDGAPARAVRWSPPDPTPGRALMLQLTALDPGPALYLGRPCQHGTRCSVENWTTGRYSESVVESLRAALAEVAASRGAKQWRLIGYSGGGTLAMLMALDLPGTVGVVTLAGNLDVAGWSELHDYTPLDASLDPALQPPLDRSIEQLHLVAGRDDVVPARLSEGVVARQHQAELRRFDDFDHTCCWAEAWPGVLDELRRTRNSSP